MGSSIFADDKQSMVTEVPVRFFAPGRNHYRMFEVGIGAGKCLGPSALGHLANNICSRSKFVVTLKNIDATIVVFAGDKRWFTIIKNAIIVEVKINSPSVKPFLAVFIVFIKYAVSVKVFPFETMNGAVSVIAEVLAVDIIRRGNYQLISKLKIIYTITITRG